MKHFIYGVVTTVLVAGAALLIYLRLGLAEVRADVPGTRLEASIMNQAVHASVRRRAPELANPIAPTNENLIAGGKIYLDECSGCHGAPGEKGGTGGASLYPPIPQLAKVQTTYSEAQIFWIAKHGIRRTGMFANGMWDSDQKLWTVAAYIKRMDSLPPSVREALQKKPAPATQQ
jgi:mono/diheme cytochrome c family protein